jgi:serine/threonine protein kinase
MDPERYQKVKNLCQSALDIEQGMRGAYLREACAGDESLRKEVEALLAHQTEAGGFLKDPAIGVAAKELARDPAARLKTDLSGRRVAHYQIVAKIGEGGMGEVYKARDLHLDRFVALKSLPPEKVADPDRKRRFVQEARAASALNHPNIVTIHDISQEGGIDFIVMEYVAGKTLDELIPRRGMRLPVALKYAVQIADALARAHGAGIIHRDLKPSNLMVDEHGLVKVLDFGLAKLTEAYGPEAETAGTSTGEGTVLGTAAYMSPEQAEGKKVDPRSDIFSFGSVLYEMLTGQRAFQADTRASTIASILRDEPKPVSQVAKGLPREVERIVKRCLRKGPERRFQTMADLRVALEELKEESDSGALETEGVAKSKPHHRLIWMSIIVTVLGIVAVGFWFLRSEGQAPEAPMAVVPLTSYPGEESSPSFSPDGNQVAFSWNGEKQDNYDVYVKLIKSLYYRRLTTNPAWDATPAFSPDGQSIAFMRLFEDEDRSAVILIPSIGGPERKLAEFHHARGVLSWFPDGKWIATPGLALISVETGEIRKLTSPPAESEGDYTPAISPDGRTIAFARGTHVVSEIYLLDLTPDLKPKGEPKQLTHMKHSSFCPAWTADGREIIFECEALGKSSLWRVPASGSGDPKLLFPGSDKDLWPAISRQGTRLAFTREVSDKNIYRLSLTGSGARRSLPEHFLHTSRDESVPKYSPDGRQIAFSSDRTGSHGIWVSDADGSNAVEIFGQGGWPQWSPDGKRLVFDSREEGPTCVYVVRASGGKPERLTSGPDDASACFSHDGRWVYFSRVQNDQDQIWKVPSEGGKAVQITADGGYWPVESRDGKFLYYIRWSNHTLWRIPVGGGAVSQVLPSVAFGHFELMDDGIYFVPQPDKNAKAQLQFLSFATNTVNTITTLPGQITFGLAVSPDRRWVLYATDDGSGSDLMLVEKFR